MDYSRMRADALASTVVEEAVTVDTRALIDKVLARYSGEWTTLRELIQNAADAQAESVVVKFETIPSTSVPLPSPPTPSELLKHAVMHKKVKRLVVRNDGQPFTDTDWGRLKRIAEGNPDETKIGAFGVGFYSVFADCDDPFVTSGDESMAFYWKGTSLFTKRSQLPVDQRSPHTTFVLDYRTNDTPVPNLLSVCQFLATSLTFVALQRMEFWIDDWKVLALHKKISPSVPVPVSRSFDTTTQDRMMTVANVERMSTQIDAQCMVGVGWKPKTVLEKTTEAFGGQISDAPLIKSFFAKFSSSSQSAQKAKAKADEAAAQAAISEDITTIKTSSIFLGVTSAKIQTKVGKTLAVELERATKKPPPKVAKLAILTSSYDEAMASAAMENSDAATNSVDVFASVLPNKKPGGRIFIGFPTMQTTGAGLHISAPSVIPTVEREAIDLNARSVKSWNIEMLRAAGIMTRISFADDMERLAQRVKDSIPKGGKLTSKEVAQHLPEAMHIFKTYTFDDSTPSQKVGAYIDEAFWMAYKDVKFNIYSTRGVEISTKVRIPSEELGRFIDGLPVVPKEMIDTTFYKKLIDYGVITSITLQDIRDELSAKAMTKSQLTAFIKWASKMALNNSLDRPTARSLIDVAVATVEGENGDQGGVVALGSINNFLGVNKIPPTLPIPPDTLPFSLTSHCTAQELAALGWTSLDILPWVEFLIRTAEQRPDNLNMSKSADFSKQILVVIGKNWDQLSPTSKDGIVSLLRQFTVIPTKFGMRKPEESFFPSVKLFDDLPIFENLGQVKEKLLVALGVRKTLDLETIFERLVSPKEGAQKWSHVELVKYLASVRNDIPKKDLAKLKFSAICPAEGGPKGMERFQPTTKLYKVAELFEPQDSLRALKLPLLYWPGTLSARSAERQFLDILGLREYPSVGELLGMMASDDADLRVNARTYYISKYVVNGYTPSILSGTKQGILPLQENTGTLVAPSECFTDEGAAILGFNVLRRDLIPHAPLFGVARSPPIAECVKRLLAQPPLDATRASELFGYFAQRLSDIKEPLVSKLKNAAIIPVTPSGEKGNVRFTSPSLCYLGQGSTYADIFDFVDFGRSANAFLFHCGARTEPTKLELAERICQEPARLLGMLQVDRYLNLLRTLAQSSTQLKKDRILWSKLQSSKCLLASKTTTASSGTLDGDDDETEMRQYHLEAPSNIVISDDFVSFRIFRDLLLCAPEEEALEDFYLLLGARRLRSLVQEDLNMGSPVNRPELAAKIRKRVLERTKIFLHEYASDRKEIIKHDGKWLEKNLQVVMVQSISLRRKLANHHKSHTEKRSAASKEDRNGCVLYVTSEGSPDMYQIGQALCQLILTKHNHQSYTFFEPLLTLDLLNLRSRGYNVERILRAKAAEARIAEEERAKALEEEMKRVREREAKWREEASVISASEQQRAQDMENQRVVQAQADQLPSMPGAFGEDLPPSPPNQKKGRGLFSNWAKRFLDSGEQNEEEAAGPSAPAGGAGNQAQQQQQQQRPPGQREGRVSNPALVHQNLLSAIKASRPYGSNEVFSQPTMNEVQEQRTYCDSTHGHNLAFIAESASGMKIYADKGVENAAAFFSSNSGAVNAFAVLLRDAADIYKVSHRVLHVFYDTTGGTIAFNLNGSLFFNFRFFLQLHASKIGQPQGKADAGMWWWVVMAHELAHNLVSVHSAEHSYYTESFIQEYLVPCIQKVTQWSGGTISAASSGPAALASAQPQPASAIPPPPPYTERPAVRRPPNNLLD
ncbi:hypothetical protein jhhlp_006550 [Lomentospora prolificans]|uniref:Sacsin/Nov domain-containing protein n=1 Tax=Lomentospora prolificans TaxID=41688 RepID=A0A2N3N685_9PEZI|nr:hypothetical protein jhhlp_006550 [Lomentospora prolificans]